MQREKFQTRDYRIETAPQSLAGARALAARKRSGKSRLVVAGAAVLTALAGFSTALGAARTGNSAPASAGFFDMHGLNDVRSGGDSMSNSRGGELVCDLSAFFSVEPDEVIKTHAHLEGRGLVTCRNPQGFTTELPVRADIEATLPEHFDRESEFAFSANSTPFVIPREVSQLQDSFSIAPAIEPNDGTPTSPAVLLRGARHDLVIGVRLNSVKSKLAGIKLNAVSLKFDDEAPDLF